MAADPPVLHRKVALALDGKSHNSIALPMAAPVACQLFEQGCFDFDEVFCTPAIKTPLDELAACLKTHEQSKIALFGHADPDGGEDYNRVLSERRARAVLAVLRHQPDEWKALARETKHPDKHLNVLWSHLKRWLEELAVVAIPDDNDARLWRYFHELWPEQDKLAEDRFVDGRATQGCGEFNPVLELTSAERQSLSRSDRHEKNLKNRRVTAYVFRPDAVLHEATWPCTPASKGSGPCRERFWSEKSRARRDDESEKTRFFQCRFYERIAWESPCEQPGEAKLRVAVFPRWSLDPATRHGRHRSAVVAREILEYAIMRYDDPDDVIGFDESHAAEQKELDALQTKSDAKWLALNKKGDTLSAEQYAREAEQIWEDELQEMHRIIAKHEAQAGPDQHEVDLLSSDEIHDMEKHKGRAIFLVDLHLVCTPATHDPLQSLRAKLEVRRLGEEQPRLSSAVEGLPVDRTTSGSPGDEGTPTRPSRFENVPLHARGLAEQLRANLAPGSPATMSPEWLIGKTTIVDKIRAHLADKQ